MRQDNDWQNKLTIILWKQADRISENFRKAKEAKSQLVTLQVADAHKELTEFMIKQRSEAVKEFINRSKTYSDKKPKCITQIGDTNFINFHNFDEYGQCEDCPLMVSGKVWEKVKEKLSTKK